MALTYFPLSRPSIPRAVVVGKQSLTANQSIDDLNNASPDEKGRSEGESSDEVLRYETAEDLNHVVMDRMSPSAEDEER